MTLTKKHIETITCDTCGATASRNCDEQFFGGHPFGGWYTLDKITGSTSIKELQKPHKWHFCSIGCLSNWLEVQNYADKS